MADRADSRRFSSLSLALGPGVHRAAALYRKHGLILVAFLAGALYLDVLWELVAQWWSDENYSHGFIVAAVAAHLLWRRRKKLAAVPLNPSWLGLPVLAAGCLMLLLGRAAAEFFTMRSSFLVVSAGLVTYLAGFQALRLVAFPLFFFALAIPIPYIVYDAAAFPLRIVATKLAINLLALAGVPVLGEGNTIHLPGATLMVADACSGIRSLMSLLALAVIVGYYSLRSLWRRLALLILVIPVTVAMNGLRVSAMCYLYRIGRPDLTEGFFHTVLGLVSFGLALGLLYGAALLMSGPARRGAGDDALR